MSQTDISDALTMLTTNDLSYGELVDLYNDLRTGISKSAETTVSKRALAQVLGNLIDYLDFIEADLEKSMGITRMDERKRILDTFEEPHGAMPVERVYQFIQQWEAIERYSTADLSVITEQ